MFQLKNLQGVIDYAQYHFDKIEYDSAHKVWAGADMVAQLKNAGVGPEHLQELTVC